MDPLLGVPQRSKYGVASPSEVSTDLQITLITTGNKKEKRPEQFLKVSGK